MLEFLKSKPYKIGMPDHAVPTSFGLTKIFILMLFQLLKQSQKCLTLT